jgi:hypothetical protein
MSVHTKDLEDGSLADAVANLITVGSRTGFSVLSSLFGGTSSVLGAARPAMARRHGRTCRNCHIPPPCWEPQPLGTFASRACPGASATIRIRVTNCGSSPRTVKMEPSPSSKGLIIKPAELVLGPEERGYAVVSFEVAPDAAEGEVSEFLVWVRGCHEHFFRWRVRVGRLCGGSCPEVEVDDCPDNIHHWYDHFYCERGCPQPQVKR